MTSPRVPRERGHSEGVVRYLRVSLSGVQASDLRKRGYWRVELRATEGSGGRVCRRTSFPQVSGGLGGGRVPLYVSHDSE